MTLDVRGGGVVTALRGVSARRPGGDTVLAGLDWAMRPGEAWAVVGPAGGGKTTFLEVLAGKLAAVGEVVRPAGPVRLVSFREESRQFSYANHYYQERFDFADADEKLTLAAFLGADPGDDLGLADLLPLEFIKLSNGQVRRARLAKALLARPALLLLDDPFMGLDAAGRAELSALLGKRVAAGLPVVLTCRPSAVPAWVTNVLEIQGGHARELTVSVTAARAATECGPYKSPAVGAALRGGPALPPVVELANVTVRYGGKPILDDITWTVRRGERWAVLGPNGAGKTTLLSLLCGDHPQAYANRVSLFGRRRGTGESIWDVKRAVGLVSPELHLYFTAPLTALEAVETGFFDVTTRRPAAPDQRSAARDLLAAFGLGDAADRPFARLSTGRQRLALLARALVKRPPLVVLDEPFQGLDDDQIAAARTWLDARLTADQTLLFVTHHDAELPATVTHTLRLAGGRVVGTAGPGYTPGSDFPSPTGTST